ncbi:MAG: hypothetical protein A2W09_02185 [Deltaproteobacteria bacterium RBG_16_50_11]|nr:MAG: hypothetical protein A2W09_02185 [Deltaproteobacteria bacterium RBG_16_50_11]
MDCPPFEVQKDLLIKGWMSHDARWFMAVAERFGIEEANRLNQKVCRELGQVEMRRFMKALNLPLPKNIEQHLSINKAAISLYGPDLIEYEIKVLDRPSYEMHIKRCFAHENVVKAGIKDQYECGILARVQGWMDAQGLEHELTPTLGRCMKVLGKECCYILKLRFD